MFNKKFISMDIGARSINIISGKNDKGIYYIDKVISINTPLGSFDDGRLIDSDKLANEIKTIIKKMSINTKNLILTLNSSSIITREIVLPSIREDEMENMAKYEIGQYLPIELNQYVVEYKKLEECEEENIKKSKVLVAAIQNSIVESYFNFAKSLNLVPISMDINSNAISKLLQKNIKINNTLFDPEKTIALIDLGHKSINVSIVAKGKLKFSRLIQQGGDDINIGLVNAFNLDYEAAERKKLENYHLNLMDDVVQSDSLLYESIKMVADSWIQDIQRIIQFYGSRNTGNKIDQIFIYGGSSNLVGLEQYMSRSMSIPTNKIESLSNIKLPKGMEDFDIKCYLNAIGAISKIGR